ncbi:hypothetical protein NZ698_14660 [Chryseobacterium sp. PBS4-4]|uniref:Uncharacterized protein n=1 Tax=Chryseobacterium edaphi TaxID=2976532 RepID=A0ABT2WAH8_9FLAO|nr:hypothetical protein [Chryseobacterium edaphi]MCU7618439.1 hypothetical protein [Chryseobacterium edaphi]
MKKTTLFILIILTLNSCFLAITGAPHNHSYREINGYSNLNLHVHCMYLNKTFEIRNANPNDSVYIKSSHFNKLAEKVSFNEKKRSDSIRFYNLRIGDMKYHRNLTKDIIEIIITNQKNEKVYKFVAESKRIEKCDYR